MLDSIDKRILEILYTDGRSSASRIAEDVSLSVPATADRIKKLQDLGIIIGFGVAVYFAGNRLRWKDFEGSKSKDTGRSWKEQSRYDDYDDSLGV